MTPVKPSDPPALEIRDYSGEGEWSAHSLMDRYRRYCAELGIGEPLDLSPREHCEGNVVWRYPVMEMVIDGIEKGDAACRRIGIEFIEDDGKFPFGKILKSNTARALRRSELTANEKDRIRRRVVAMLVAGHIPHEYGQYAKLLKKIGVGDAIVGIETKLDLSNQYVERFYKYLKDLS